MHAPLLIIADQCPDDGADTFVNQDEFDSLRWVGDQSYEHAGSWDGFLTPYLLPSSTNESADSGFEQSHGKQGLLAAPRLSQVDLNRLMLEGQVSHVAVDGSLFKRESWCVAHKKMEEDPDFIEDTIESVSFYLKRTGNRAESIRVWLYDGHV
jgi:hypothetical protein